MKQNILKNTMAILCGALSILACSDDSSVIDNNTIGNKGEKATIFSASFENDGNGSRTYLDGLAVKWAETDFITVFGKDGGATDFVLKSGAGTANAVFTGATTETDRYYAVYPGMGSCSSNVISGITIPQVQQAVPGSFDPAANVMVATCTSANKNLAFKNVCSYVKIDIKYPCSSIEVTATGASIAGNFNVTVADDGTHSLTAASDAKSKITLVPVIGTAAIPVGTYYVAMAPATVSSFTIDCIGTDGIKASKTKAGSTTIARRSIVNPGTVLRRNGWVEVPKDYEDKVVDLGEDFSVYWAKTNLVSVGMPDVLAASETEPGQYFLFTPVKDWSTSVAATSNRMRAPTKDEMLYLRNNANGSVSGNGVKLVSKTDATKSIYLPFTSLYLRYYNPQNSNIYTDVPWTGMEGYGYYFTMESTTDAVGELPYYLVTTSQDGNYMFEVVNDTYLNTPMAVSGTVFNTRRMQCIRPVYPKRNEAGL